MNNNDQKTNELYDRVRIMLMDEGLSYWEAFEAVRELDNYVYTQVSREIVSGLDDGKHKELDKLMDMNTPMEEIAEFVGVSVEEMQERYTKKLEEYIALFPEKIASLKNPKTDSPDVSQLS